MNNRDRVQAALQRLFPKGVIGIEDCEICTTENEEAVRKLCWKYTVELHGGGYAVSGFYYGNDYLNLIADDDLVEVLREHFVSVGQPMSAIKPGCFQDKVSS